MNINCIICADSFNPNSDIYTTHCGHAFHYVCLIRWFERSKSCPQCRQKANEKSICRIFFNFGSVEGTQEDAVSLQNKLDSLSLNLRMKEKDYREIDEKFKKVVDDNSVLTNIISENKHELDKCKSGIAALKEQLLYAKVKAKEAEKVENELKAMRETVARLEHITKGLSGSYEDVQDVARNCQDVKTLSQIMVSLKGSNKELEKKQDKMFRKMKSAERDLHACKKELGHIIKENEILKNQLQTHEKCDGEKQILKKRLEELSQEMLTVGSKMDPQMQRVIMESPMPQLTRSKTNQNLDSFTDVIENKKEKPKELIINNSFEIIDSPDIAARVKKIKDSDSPYLQVKSNSMGRLLQSQGLSSNIGNPSGTSIFRSKRIETSSKPKPIPEDVSYNGMGGTERNLFIKSQPTHGMKRQKSSTSIRSSKLKKLAKPSAQTKIMDFINISDTD